MSTEYTAAQYNAAISAAIRDLEMGMAVRLLRLMAVHHPHEAALTYDVNASRARLRHVACWAGGTVSLTSDVPLFDLAEIEPPRAPLTMPDNLLPLQDAAGSAAEIIELYSLWRNERAGRPYDPDAPTYAWRPTICGPRADLDTYDHDPLILDLDLRCNDYSHRHQCRCVGDLIYRFACTGCTLIGSPHDSENAAVEDAMNHQWAGWRDLPILRCSMPQEGKSRKRWTDAALEVYPDGWLEAGGPVRTARDRIGRRHVPDRTPWDGYDLGVVVAEHWHSDKPGVFDPARDLAVAESLEAAR